MLGTHGGGGHELVAELVAELLAFVLDDFQRDTIFAEPPFEQHFGYYTHFLASDGHQLRELHDGM